MSDPVLDQLTALLETARREAYERGYADAVRRIVAAAGATVPTGGTAEPAAAPAQAAPQQAAPIPARLRPNAAETAGDQPRRQRAKRGSIEARPVEIPAPTRSEGATL